MTLGTIENNLPRLLIPFLKDWNGITVTRSYIPAGRGISGADAEQIIYDTFTATVLLHTPHATKLDLLPSLLDF